MQLLFLGLLALSSSVVFACETDMDCSLAGTCAAGTCQCFSGFNGSDCGALALGAALVGGGWLPPNHTTWGGSPIKVGDTFHLYASLNRYGDVDTWPNTSVIVHATSKQAAGPYEQQSVILGPRSRHYFDSDAVQNPVALQLHDGTIALYYVALNCQAPYPYGWLDCLDSANSSLGVAHAPGPWGPWTRPDDSILSVERPIGLEGDALANPAAWQEADGSILFAYRGRHDEVLPMATAKHWSGPYTRLDSPYPGRSTFPSQCAPLLCNGTMCTSGEDAPKRLQGKVRNIGNATKTEFYCLEDPFLFRIKSGSYHMLMHNQGDAVGVHAFSADGRNWTLSHTAAYGLTVVYEDGNHVKMYRREEPKVLFQDGFATHLFNAACPNPKLCGTVVGVPLVKPIELYGASMNTVSKAYVV